MRALKLIDLKMRLAERFFQIQKEDKIVIRPIIQPPHHPEEPEEEASEQERLEAEEEAGEDEYTF